MQAELLRGIADNPDDVGTWMAYADWLQQENAPRGELIALDIALETAVDKIELLERRSELMAAQAETLLGSTFSKFIGEGYGTISWRRGFVHRLRYDGEGLAHKRAVGWLIRVICDEYPEPFTFLHRISLPSSDLASLEPLARFERLADLDIRSSKVTDLAPVTKFPALRELDVRGCEIRFSQIAELGDACPHLKVRS